MIALFLSRNGCSSALLPSHTAAAIATGDLTQRIPVRQADDEVTSLSRSLNVMLTRIESSFAVREASVRENVGTVRVAVELDWAPTAAVSVPILTSGTATLPSCAPSERNTCPASRTARSTWSSTPSKKTVSPKAMRSQFGARLVPAKSILRELANFREGLEDARLIRLAQSMKLDDALANRIKQQIRDTTTPRHVPDRIVQVPDIPRTKSGKIVELAVREVVHGRPVKNTDALANPAALDWFAAFAADVAAQFNAPLTLRVGVNTGVGVGVGA